MPEVKALASTPTPTRESLRAGMAVLTESVLPDRRPIATERARDLWGIPGVPGLVRVPLHHMDG